MRNVVIAFNFLSVFYAIGAALSILTLTSLVTIQSINTHSVPFATYLLVFLLPANLLLVNALKRRKLWAYIGCAVHIAMLILCSLFSIISSKDFSLLTQLLILVLLFGFASLLYKDYLFGRNVHNKQL